MFLFANLGSVHRTMDNDGNGYVSVRELREYLQSMKSKELGFDQDFAVNELMKHFDQDSNKEITVDEFIDGVQRFIDDAERMVVHNPHAAQKYLPLLCKVSCPHRKFRLIIRLKFYLTIII